MNSSFALHCTVLLVMFLSDLWICWMCIVFFIHLYYAFKSKASTIRMMLYVVCISKRWSDEMMKWWRMQNDKNNTKELIAPNAESCTVYSFVLLHFEKICKQYLSVWNAWRTKSLQIIHIWLVFIGLTFVVECSYLNTSTESSKFVNKRKKHIFVVSPNAFSWKKFNVQLESFKLSSFRCCSEQKLAKFRVWGRGQFHK